MPWLARIGLAASGALSIKSAAGKTEIEGDASSPAAARIGDVADCGSLTFAPAPGIPSPGVVITYTPPVGTPTVITLLATGLTAAVLPPGPVPLVSKLTSGSGKVRIG